MGPTKTLYIVAAHTRGPCKIGWAHHPEKRLRELQTGNPDRLRLWYTSPCSMGDRLERALHEHFRDERLQGEWFLITVQQAAEALVAVQMDGRHLDGRRCPECHGMTSVDRKSEGLHGRVES